MADTDDFRLQLVELQNQLAFQEDTVQALNASLAAQQREIMVLRRQLELLQQRQDEQAGAADHPAGAAAEEKPPHY